MEIAWSLVLFTALTGCGGWLFVGVAIDEFTQKTSKANFISAIVALVLMIVGGLCSVTHLAHPENMLAALNHPTSGIFVEAVLVGIASAFIIVYLIAYGRNATLRRICAVAGAVVGVALSFMAGHSYLMDAVSNWNTMLLPLAYLGTAAASGFGVYALIAGIRHGQTTEADLKIAFILLTVGGIAAALTSLLYLMGVMDAADLMLVAVGAVAVGGVEPLACGVAGLKATNSATLLAAIATVGALIGAVCLRCAMWMAYVPLENFFGIVM